MLDGIRSTGHACCLGAVGCGALRYGGGRNCDALNCYVGEEEAPNGVVASESKPLLGIPTGIKLKRSHYIASLDSKLDGA